MKSEALIGGVLQGAFNHEEQFCKIHGKTSALKSLFNKGAGLMVCNFIKKEKLWHRCFPVSFPNFFRRLTVEHVRTNAWVKWTKKNQNHIHKNYSAEKTPSQMPFYKNCEVLQNIIFTEHCCATASHFLQHFQWITCFISKKLVQS